MPRKPTGRGRGRPKGSGQLGEEGVDHIRLTVRLPRELYDALEARAERDHYTREAPELARCVREALEHYLTCPNIRQTRIVPPSVLDYSWQTVNAPELVEANIKQTTILPETDHITEEARAEKRQPKNSMSASDLSKYVLGKLCPRGHEYQGSGQSLLRRANLGCLACDAEKARERREARRLGRV